MRTTVTMRLAHEEEIDSPFHLVSVGTIVLIAPIVPDRGEYGTSWDTEKEAFPRPLAGQGPRFDHSDTTVSDMALIAGTPAELPAQAGPEPA